MVPKSFRAGMVVVLALVVAGPVQAQRTKLEPGYNIYSPQDDVEIGRQVSAEAEKELPIITDDLLSEYVNRLGLQLAGFAPGERYPYQFKLVNDPAINAFALPGGFIYVNRGIIETADREAELAGVMAHEIGHVALRHGTNQQSRNSIFQGIIGVLGGLFGGGNGVGSIVAQAGAGIGAAAFFNRFSRDAERQADLMGTQILYDAGWDPTAMPEFFEKLEAEGGSRGPEFLSSHPNPGNRAASVAAEIAKLGPRPDQYRDNFSDFRRIKTRLEEIGESSDDNSTQVTAPPYTEPPEGPSTRYEFYRGMQVELVRPNNWMVHDANSTLTIAPERGIQTNGSLAYGLMISRVEPTGTPQTLTDASNQLLDSLRDSNPTLGVEQRFRDMRIGGRNGLRATLSSESSYGGRERDILVTAFGPDGRTLIYFVAVVREADAGAYERTFDTILNSVRFR